MNITITLFVIILSLLSVKLFIMFINWLLDMALGEDSID